MRGLADDVARDGFDSAGNWLAAAKLTPAELAAFASELTYDPVNSADTGRWIEWLGTMLPPEKLGDAIPSLVSDWIKDDYQAVGKWLAATPDSPARNISIQYFAESVSRYNPTSAAAWALTLPVGPERDMTLEAVQRNWSKEDPAAAAAFAQLHGIPK